MNVRNTVAIPVRLSLHRNAIVRSPGQRCPVTHATGTAGTLMTATATALPQAPPRTAVPFTKISVAETVACDDHDVHFQCAAGYEEWARSWEPDDVADIHRAFQAGGHPYTVTTYSRRQCDPGDCRPARHCMFQFPCFEG